MSDISNTEKTKTKENQKPEWINEYVYATNFAYMADSKVTLDKDDQKSMKRYKRVLEKIKEKNSYVKHTYQFELLASELDEYFKTWKTNDISLVKTTSPPWIFECDCVLMYTKNNDPISTIYVPFGKLYNLMIRKRKNISPHNLPESMLYYFTRLMMFFVKPETREFLEPTSKALGISIDAVNIKSNKHKNSKDNSNKSNHGTEKKELNSVVKNDIEKFNQLYNDYTHITNKMEDDTNSLTSVVTDENSNKLMNEKRIEELIDNIDNVELDYNKKLLQKSQIKLSTHKHDRLLNRRKMSNLW